MKKIIPKKRIKKKIFSRLLIILLLLISFFFILFYNNFYNNYIKGKKISTDNEPFDLDVKKTTEESLLYQNNTLKMTRNMAKEGLQEYAIMQISNSPQFYKAIINPEKVSPGEMQTMTVFLKDDKYDIKSVIAEIETDTKIQKYQLSLIKGNYRDGVWEGTWIVTDTSTKTYRTKFIAENSRGEVSSAILSWTDPGTGCKNIDCTISSGTITISGVDGADGGTLTISGGSITVPSGATLIAGALSISGGVLALNSGGIVDIKSGNTICMTDADSDNYPANTNQIAYCTSGRRRYLMASISQTDCYDSNANAKPGQTSCFTTHRGDGSFDYNCNGVVDKCSPILYSYQTCNIYNCGGINCVRALRQENFICDTSSNGEVTCGSSGYQLGSPKYNCKTCCCLGDCECIDWGLQVGYAFGASGTQTCN